MSPPAPLPRILLVDDNSDNLFLMQLFLGGEPYSVDVALNGREAVDKFRAAPYDLVFMDLEMPLLDGYGATRAIRELEQERRAGSPPVPILVLTAHALDEFRARCEAAGCTDFLVKPVRKSAVLAAVARYLGQAAAPSQAAPPIAPLAPEIELLRPLFPVFFATATGTLDEARRALDRGDMEGMRRQGHKLKGSALSYGFNALGQAALDMERAGEDDDPAAARTALDRAVAMLDEARKASP
ncbi:MAG: response regulator [Solidesulfovibrio sp. DCME]|uniref:response regulator n=1 Tax=Solidesulfovibrio sp. DCME TaxID=3447380 RepID=UPI003D0A7056